MRFSTRLLAILLTACLIAGCDGKKSGDDKDGKSAEGKRPKIAFVTNCIANFWTIGEAGALKAGEDLNCDVEVRMPPSEGGVAANQKRILESLISKGVQGIAVSPCNPANQVDILNEVGNNAIFITHDSDAPNSNRKYYIGMSNYDAGRMVGEMVKQALPNGGNIIIFVGSIDQDNGKLRRQGVIDEILDRSHDAKRFDEPGSAIKGDKYTILATRIDNMDGVRKKELPQQALAKFDDIQCMVGLFEYNPPFIMDALKSAGKLGEIKVVGFDENDRTLEEIRKGNCVGTVVQDPFMYGYKSVEVLAKLVRGEKLDIEGDFIDIPARKIQKDNVDEFQQNLKALLESEK